MRRSGSLPLATSAVLLAATLFVMSSAIVAADQGTPIADRFVSIPHDGGLPRGRIWRTGFAVADIDQDGVPDVVHGPPRKQPGPLRVFLGSREGLWQQWTSPTLSSHTFDYGDVAVTDLDGDGRLDVLVASHLGDLTLLVGDGSGGWRQQPLPGIASFSSRAVEVVDWNGDGRNDVAALGEGPARNGQASSRGITMILAANRGIPLRAIGLPAAGMAAFGDALAAGDFDGDDDVDVVTASHVLGDRMLVIANDGARGRLEELDGLGERCWVWSVAAADFNEDGLDDVAVSSNCVGPPTPRVGVDVLLSDPSGGRRRAGLLTSSDLSSTTRSLSTGDADGDGHFDLAAVTDSGSIQLFRGLGDGRFELEKEPRWTPAESGCRGNHIRLVDLDGDGRDDLVASFGSEDCPTVGALRAWLIKPR